jgi:hypothetical protein
MANSGIVAGGILLLLVGLVASFYYESKTIFGIEYMRTYPYQNAGIALIVAGAILIGFGAIYSSQKTAQQPIGASSPATIHSFAIGNKFCAIRGEKLPQGATHCPKCGAVVPSWNDGLR